MVVRIVRDGAGIQPERATPAGSFRPQSETVKDTAERPPNLFFTTESPATLAEADIIFLAVNTPTKTFGTGAGRATDMSAIDGAVKDIAAYAKPGAIIVEKSTVPCRTADRIRNSLSALRPKTPFEVLSNPEFLSEGTAVKNSLSPDRILIGSNDTPSGRHAAATLSSLYNSWLPASKILTTNVFSSELSKLVANAMLAQRISSINSISAICECTGADVAEVSKAVGLDARIGPQFLNAGLGFGGSCFRKDIASLTYLAETLGLPDVAHYWDQVLHINDLQRSRFAQKIISRVGGSLVGKRVALLGFAFKANTGDTRESLAVDLIRELLDERPGEIAVFDPGCRAEDIWQELGRTFGTDATYQDVVRVYDDPYAACREAEAVAVVTGWDMFKFPSPEGSDERHLAVDKDDSAMTVSDSQRNHELAPVEPDIDPSPETFTIPTPSSSSGTTTFLLKPVPPCPHSCTLCAARSSSYAGSVSRKAQALDFLDWARVLRDMRAPRGVFDGRGVLDVENLEALGRDIHCPVSIERIGMGRRD